MFNDVSLSITKKERKTMRDRGNVWLFWSQKTRTRLESFQVDAGIGTVEFEFDWLFNATLRCFVCKEI